MSDAPLAERIREHLQLANAERSDESLKVILSYRDQRIRGLVDRDEWPLLRSAGPVFPLSWFHPLDDTGSAQRGDRSFIRDCVKAFFVVRSFEGDRDHDPIYFHGPDVTPPEWLWVKVTFTDGEVLEGMTENEAAFLLNEGFLLHPTDPTGNNLLIYVLKAQVQDFRVLGLRQRFRRAGTLPGDEVPGADDLPLR